MMLNYTAQVKVMLTYWYYIVRFLIMIGCNELARKLTKTKKLVKTKVVK